jgi:hypothetical protein
VPSLRVDVADALTANGVNVVFSTGYGADAVDGAYRRYPRCEKPFASCAFQ